MDLFGIVIPRIIKRQQGVSTEYREGFLIPSNVSGRQRPDERRGAHEPDQSG